MELPTPPTDNFYKFFAILGGLIVLASLTSPIWLHRQVDEQQAEYIRDATIQNLEASEWQQIGTELDRASTKSDEAQKRLVEAVDKLVAGKNALDEAEQALTAADKARKEVMDKVKEGRQKTLEWSKKNAELKYKEDLLKIKTARAESAEVLSVFGLIVGAFMSGAGFTLWYRRTQKFEDAALRKKATTDKEEGEQAD